VILPDVNVLVYAFRCDSEEHDVYRSWLEGVINGATTYGVSPQVLASVIQITTHLRVYKRPSRLSDALAFASVIRDQPQCQIIEPGPRHWSIFTALCQSSHTYGNLVQHAWLAALAIEHGCEWITNDRDYARFEGLQWRTLSDLRLNALTTSSSPLAGHPPVRKTL